MSERRRADEERPDYLDCVHRWVSAVDAIGKVWWCYRCGLSGGSGPNSPEVICGLG